MRQSFLYTKIQEKEGLNMITLVRWCLLKSKKIKWELALWQFLDKQLTELLKNPEDLEKKLLSYLGELVHNSNQTEA